MNAISIVVLSVLAAIAYGIVHDQITARVCVEYFTIGHPPVFVFETSDPTLLGFAWGIIATWWMGVLLGVPLAVAARAGSRPKWSLFSLIRPITILLGIMGVSALVSGIAGWLAAKNGLIFLVGPMAETIPHDRHILFLADLWAHSASYIVGFVGGIAVIISVWRSRSQRVEPL